MIVIGLLDQFSEWWDNLTAARQLFYGIGIVAGFVAVILAVLSLFGFEHHDATDALGAHDLAPTGGLLSVKPLTGFFLGFGWAGGLALDQGFSLMASIVIAVLSGAALMGLILVLYRAINSMRSDGTVRISDALGAVGTVYVTVPPRKGSGGQVTVTFRGRQETLAALTGAEQPIVSGEKVKVVSVVDGRTVLVESL